MGSLPDMTPEQQKVLERQREQQKQLILDYKRLFSSDLGSRILDDLKEKFGFNRESATYGTPALDCYLREGMKQPLRYIVKLLEAKLDEKPEQTEAIHHGK